MNKKQIIAALMAAGVTADPKLPIAELKALAEENGISTEAVTPSVVLVKVTGQPVCEGPTYTKGQTFETPLERALALGSLVEIVTPE